MLVVGLVAFFPAPFFSFLPHSQTVRDTDEADIRLSKFPLEEKEDCLREDKKFHWTDHQADEGREINNSRDGTLHCSIW